MKYYLKENGKEVRVGDTLALTEVIDTIFGKAKATTHVTVTQDNLQTLILHDIIRKKENIVLTCSVCNKIIADKLGIREDEADSFLAKLIAKKMLSTVLEMFLKAASDYLSPSIEEVKALPKVYTISTIDGRIHEVQTTDIKTYEHFAYFVSKTQAKQARALFEDLLKAMYGE